MTRKIITHNEVEGFHYYPNAPIKADFLRHRHRHLFIVVGEASVSHNEREIEIILAQREIEDSLYEKFGKPCEFRDMSCESIAEWLLNKHSWLDNVKVLEDGYGGASLTR